MFYWTETKFKTLTVHLAFKSCSRFYLGKKMCVRLSDYPTSFEKLAHFNGISRTSALHIRCCIYCVPLSNSSDTHTLDVYRCVCVCVTMKPFLSYYPHRQAQKRWKEREGKCVIERKKRFSFQSRTQKKSFVVHHTSVWEGDRDRLCERGCLKRLKGKRLNGKKNKKAHTHTHTYSKKLSGSRPLKNNDDILLS